MFGWVQYIDKYNWFYIVQFKFGIHRFAERVLIPVWMIPQILRRFLPAVTDDGFIDIGRRVFCQMDRRRPEDNRQAGIGGDSRHNRGRDFACFYAVEKCHFIYLRVMPWPVYT